MAGTRFLASTTEAGLAVSGSDVNLLRLTAASNRRLLVEKVGISWDRTDSGDDSCELKVFRGRSGATYAAGLSSLVNSGDGGTLSSIVTVEQYSSGTESSAGTCLFHQYVHNNAVLDFSSNPLPIKGGEILSFHLDDGTNTANANCWALCRDGGLFFKAIPSEYTLSVGTAKTVCQLVAASHVRVLVHEMNLSFAGTDTDGSPVLVKVYVQDDAGTSSALTLNKLNSDDDETLQTTARETFTAEPTTDSTLLFQRRLHPVAGATHCFGFNKPLIVPQGTRLGVKLTSSAALSGAIDLLCEE